MGKKEPYSEWIDLLKQEGQGIEFNDGDDQATLVVRPEAAPFPDIPAEAPGILTEHGLLTIVIGVR
jgi:hypothetical protein